MVREIEGVLSRFGKRETISILVALLKNNFTQNSIDRVESSEFNLIFTDEKDLSSDLIKFIEIKRIESTQCNEELIQQIKIIGQNESSNKFRS
ncbi:17503_t:CDS:1, partial [Racocetra persica]